MIHDKELAKQINDLMERCSKEVDESIRLVQQKCTSEEFKAYRRGAGMVMGYIYTDVLAPLWKEHPELEPAGMKEPD